jgi:hypothetical protein
MAGISISELISKDDTTNVSDGFLPISINNNTFKIKAATFLEDTSNCVNNFVTKVQEQSAVITQCITDSNTLCASIECNTSTINSVIDNTRNIYNCVTELSGCIILCAAITETNSIRNCISDVDRAVENIRTRFTTLSAFTDNVNNEVLSRGSAIAVDNLSNRVTALDSTVLNNSTDICNLSGQVCALDVCGNAVAIESLNQRIIKNENFIENNAVNTSTLNGCISEINGKIDAKASSTDVNAIESRLTTTEGVATGAANNITTINNCITNINDNLTLKANASQVNSLVSSVNTAQSDATAALNCGVSLQTQLNNSSKASVAAEISNLTSSVSDANTQITAVRDCNTSLNTTLTNLAAGCACAGFCALANSVDSMELLVNGSGVGSITETKNIAISGGDVANSFNAKYGININNCGIVSGFCLNAGGGTSSMIIQADCFILADQTNSNSGSPFSVINNCVRMCGACIKDLSVDTLQINGQAISSCSIVEGNNKSYSIATTNNSKSLTPLGGYQNLAQATITSAGCPTVVAFGYSGVQNKTGYFTPVRIGSSGGRNGTNYCCIVGGRYKYGYEVRVLRGSTPLTVSNNNNFLDTNPGSGVVTYTLQARFCRCYGTVTCSKRTHGFTYGRYSRPAKTTCTEINVIDAINQVGNKIFGAPTTQSITITNPFIEVRQSKR